MTSEPLYAVFQAARRLIVGTPAEAALAAHKALEVQPDTPVIVFDRATGAVVDLDLRGDEAAIQARYAPTPEVSPEIAPETVKRGRPKLGVVPREVTLLPRHWEWLGQQPGGASVTLRKLIDAARKGGPDPKARLNAAYRVMVTLAGDREGFEEASRALFAGDRDALRQRLAVWPADIGKEVLACLAIDLTST
ncbi:DUF2239 family protein [Asticcacaulis excentricus]|uniref:DUF2239 family protein n=1 Tax=Asticcacaulis excentricus (strain ATCC 15261 / DSM 4724 / KCTC 12464 / NCIMB 9791 / VKM B-1370 / CB 48) TaxID=573065 RepID=E8RQF8_ASTEC|nr:DUF2239 family protein [Asticcacaulis excentricus]ADU12142.1 Protein of unknown function DUF2239 [Asticcacaulis excentricus CB 48]